MFSLKIRFGRRGEVQAVLIGVLALALLFSSSVAYGADLTYSANATIDLSDPDIDLTILQGSTATSLAVGTGSFTVVVPESGRFTVTSASRNLTTTGGTANGTISVNCAAGVATFEVLANVGSQTITVTPTSGACTAPTIASIGSGGGGGGGGGGGYTAPTPVVTASTTVATTTAATAPTTKAAPASGSTPSAAITSVPGLSVARLALLLKRGSENNEVKLLQMWLAKDPAIYPEGSVLGYFGPATERAVQRFQKKHGVVSEGTPSTTGYGMVGMKTRAKLNEVYASVATTITPATPATTPTAIAMLTLVLKRGSENNEVKLLQMWLAKDPAIYPEGSVLGYFGPATERAVQRFQKKHGVVSEGTPSTTGYGMVGMKTRAKLNEVYQGAGSVASPVSAPMDDVAARAKLQSQVDELQKVMNDLLKKAGTAN